MPNYFSIKKYSLDDSLRRIINEHDENEIYIAINLINKNISEDVVLQFCEEKSISSHSTEEFIAYANKLSEKNYNSLIISLELFNLLLLEKLELYKKYTRLRQESLLLLCKHDSIEFTTSHDVAYYFTTRYTEDQILDFIKIERNKKKSLK